jgi:hypothetical protein
MNTPRKTAFWTWTIVSVLVFIGSVIFFAIKLAPSEDPVVLPIYGALFILFFLLYFTSVDQWLAGRRGSVRFALTTLLLAPALLLSIWLGLVERDPISPLVWFAPFLGIAAGLNLRAALGKTPS